MTLDELERLHAAALRGAEEIADMAGAAAVGDLSLAAGDAAADAAWSAAADALTPTTEKLQASALDLVRRMLAVHP